MAAEQNDDSRIKLPVSHDNCPICGSKKRLVNQTVEDLKKDKALPDTFICEGLLLQAPLFDAVHPPQILSPVFTVKVINAVIDFCGEPGCGAAYCRSFNVIDQPAQLQQPSQGFRNFPR